MEVHDMVHYITRMEIAADDQMTQERNVSLDAKPSVRQEPANSLASTLYRKKARAGKKIKGVVRLMIIRNGKPQIVYVDDTRVDSKDGGEPQEMSRQQKKALYEAVVDGNIDLVDDLLDLPSADINMEWFGENLLMAAMRASDSHMAAFLLDSNINRNFETTRLEMKNRTKGELDCFTVSCRQMAYERGMQDILDIIDELNNNTWSFIKKPRREKRCKRPLQDKLKERFEQEEAERKQRGETEAHLRQRMGKEEYADVVTQGAAAVTSRTSFGSSCAFGDLTSIRSDRKSRKSTGGRNTSEPTLTNGIEAAQDRSTQNPRDNNNAANQSGASPLGEDEPGDGLPFYIPLGPTHTFSYPAEEPARSENPHRYRLNRTFVSRKQTNAQKSHQSTIILSSAFRECWTFGNQRPESQSWASRVSDSKRDPGVARSNSSPICARIISPWRENDCRGLTNLQGRTRSAPGSPETSLLTKRRDGNHRSFFPTLQSRQMVGLPKKDNYMVAKKPRAIASVRNDSIVLSRSSSVMRHVIAHNNRITDLSCTTVRGKQVSSKQVEGSIRLPGSALANEKIDQRELKSLNPESEKDVPHIMVVPPT